MIFFAFIRWVMSTLLCSVPFSFSIKNTIIIREGYAFEMLKVSIVISGHPITFPNGNIMRLVYHYQSFRVPGDLLKY